MPHTASAISSAKAFLKVAHQFKLGELETESSHPLSTDLSRLCRDDLPEAIACARAVDIDAWAHFEQHFANRANALTGAIVDTLMAGQRVFLVGCGATGRLSLALETLAREGMLEPVLAERIVSFMAGGDAALVRSIEGFEDFPEFGARQLRELGFADGDLLVASTEGGETPFVIGATEEAAQVSSRHPWFLFCNPPEQLCERVERSRRVLETPAIECFALPVGPMTIAGSTRMQASTVLMAAIGFCLIAANARCSGQRQATAPVDLARTFGERLRQFDFMPLAAFIEEEAETYRKGHRLLYETNSAGITVLTDTTERSPTFSLSIFENAHAQAAPTSLCYLSLPNTPDALGAWQTLLHRPPRTLEWEGYCGLTDLDHFLGYDISAQAKSNRSRHLPDCQHLPFLIETSNHAIDWQLQSLRHQWPLGDADLLTQHLLLKLLLNTHSTLLMGRMNRFEGNLMTYVKPSNNKLIDRTIRYVQTLHLRNTGNPVDYETVAFAVFSEVENLRPDEPVVIKVLRTLTST